MDGKAETKQDVQKPGTGGVEPKGIKPNDSVAAKPIAQQPLAQVEKEMSDFERSTLQWAKTAVFMSALAAIFVCGQWWEMHAGGVDTHNLASAAVAGSRAWVAPEQMTLGSAVESGLPLKYQVRIVNPGREPALGLVWNVTPTGVPYIPEGAASNSIKFKPNFTCSSLEPSATDGMVLYPSGPTNYWVPLDLPNTAENRQLLDDVMKKAKSLVVDGCFAYRTGGEKHTSAFRFFLRDVSNRSSLVTHKDGNSVPAWNFNATLSGNDAN
jgi:hypothetical protein